MTVPWVGVRRLALLVGVLGASIGLVAGISAFSFIRKEMDRFDMVHNALQTGTIVAHADSSLWWKDRAGEEHPYVQAVPQERPSETDVWWAVLLPIGGFLVPWGCVMVVAWVTAGFTGQRN